MSYTDKQIVDIKRKAKRKKELDVQKTIYIDGNTFSFKNRSIIDNRLSIIMPVEFDIMDIDYAAKKYPSEYRPKYIYTDMTGSVNLTFSYMDMPLHASEVITTCKDWRILMKKLNPSFVFGKLITKDNRDTKLSYFDYSNVVIDGRLFNIMFITELDEMVVIGTFCCPYTLKSTWKYIAVQMIESIDNALIEGERN